MAHRYPYDREGWERNSGDYPPDRGAGARAREGGDHWFGENEEVRLRRDAEQRRFGRDARERWGATPAWGNPGSYSSDREYGDREYARPADDARPDYSRPYLQGDDRPRGDFGGQRRSSVPSYMGVGHGHYAEPGYLHADEYGQASGGPYAGERHVAREWSGVEGWRVPGPHAGRGPRGYRRADERIQDELHERLTAHGLIDATDVECRVVEGEVTLSGFVDSRAAKRAAEDLAEDIYGVRQVRNELRIRSHAADNGVGRTSVLGLTESQLQSGPPPAETERPRTRR